MERAYVKRVVVVVGSQRNKEDDDGIHKPLGAFNKQLYFANSAFTEEKVNCML